MEKEKEELDQKEFPFMDETPPSLLFPFMSKNDDDLKLKRKGEENERINGI